MYKQLLHFCNELIPWALEVGVPVSKIKIEEKAHISFCKLLKKQIAPDKTTAEEISFE